MGTPCTPSPAQNARHAAPRADIHAPKKNTVPLAFNKTGQWRRRRDGYNVV
jgi:hypothetical protein